MKVKLKKLNENAQLPVKMKDGDLCYDVYATSEEEVSPGVWQYGLGFAYEIVRDETQIPRGQQPLFGGFMWHNHFNNPISISIDLRPRSGIYKTGMVLANSTGTLDEFYRGEAKATFYHIMKKLPRYKVGDRIGQIKLGIAIPMEFECVDEINEDTERGKDGFSSTGNK